MLVGGYFGAIGIGRVVSGVFANRLGLDQLVRLSMLTAFVGTLLFACRSPAAVGFAGLALLGLGLAPIFPCLMARTPERLGEGFATHAVGFQVSAGMLGAALVPSLAGLLAQSVGLEAVAALAVVIALLLLATHELLLRVAR
jgi:fucose permease